MRNRLYNINKIIQHEKEVVNIIFFSTKAGLSNSNTSLFDSINYH